MFDSMIGDLERCEGEREREPPRDVILASSLFSWGCNGVHGFLSPAGGCTTDHGKLHWLAGPWCSFVVDFQGLCTV